MPGSWKKPAPWEANGGYEEAPLCTEMPMSARSRRSLLLSSADRVVLPVQLRRLSEDHLRGICHALGMCREAGFNTVEDVEQIHQLVAARLTVEFDFSHRSFPPVLPSLAEVPPGCAALLPGFDAGDEALRELRAILAKVEDAASFDISMDGGPSQATMASVMERLVGDIAALQGQHGPASRAEVLATSPKWSGDGDDDGDDFTDALLELGDSGNSGCGSCLALLAAEERAADAEEKLREAQKKIAALHVHLKQVQERASAAETALSARRCGL